MRRARFTSAARSDLSAILKYITGASGRVVTGERFAKELRDKCHQLAGMPGTLGVERSELAAGLRSVPFKSYLIFFRYEGSVFMVVRIIEGHRDVPATFDSLPI